MIGAVDIAGVIIGCVNIGAVVVIVLIIVGAVVSLVFVMFVLIVTFLFAACFNCAFIFFLAEGY